MIPEGKYEGNHLSNLSTAELAPITYIGTAEDNPTNHTGTVLPLVEVVQSEKVLRVQYSSSEYRLGLIPPSEDHIHARRLLEIRSMEGSITPSPDLEQDRLAGDSELYIGDEEIGNFVAQWTAAVVEKQKLTGQLLNYPSAYHFGRIIDPLVIFKKLGVSFPESTQQLQKKILGYFKQRLQDETPIDVGKYNLFPSIVCLDKRVGNQIRDIICNPDSQGGKRHYQKYLGRVVNELLAEHE